MVYGDWFSCRYGTSATLGGRQYRAKEGVIDVPDTHEAAHQAAAVMGLSRLPEPQKAK
jgi:hypothetical protein